MLVLCVYNSNEVDPRTDVEWETPRPRMISSQNGTGSVDGQQTGGTGQQSWLTGTVGNPVSHETGAVLH